MAPSQELEIPYRIDPPDAYTNRMCRLDLYWPTAPTPGGPLLLWFHGGGLESGDKQDPRQIDFARRMVDRGISVALSNYRLSPEVSFPAYIEDAAQAVAWATGKAAALDCNPAAIYVGGESAGGYLSAMLAMAPHYLSNAGLAEDAIAGFISMSGQMMTHFTVRKERGNWNGLAIDADAAAPIHHVRALTRPLLLLVADHDMPSRLEEIRYFATAMRELAGDQQTRFHVIEDRDHCSIFERCFEPGDATGPLILDFVKLAAPA